MPSTNPVFIEQTSKILCCYFNSTNKIQIIKVLENKSASLEKIVFPQQKILFESSLKGKIEVYLQQNGQPILKNVSSYININIEKYSKKPIAV